MLGVGARGGEGGEPRHGGKRQKYLWKEDAGMDVGPDALAKGQTNLKVHVEYTCANTNIHPGKRAGVRF